MRQTREGVAINGTPLTSIDPDAVLLKVEEGATLRSFTASSPASGMGQHVDAMEQRTKDITLHVAVAIPRDRERRADVMDRITAWATQGEWDTPTGCRLTLASRPGRYLWCRCANLPQLGDLSAWTQGTAITMRAYAVPLWQADAPMRTAATLAAGSTQTMRATNTGNAPTRLWAEITPTSALTSVTIAAKGGDVMKLRGLSVAAGTVLRVGYDAEDRLYIRAGDASVLSKLSTNSSDYITLAPGATTISVATDAPAEAALYAYGRWY